MASTDSADVMLRLDDDSLKKDPEEVFTLLEQIGEGSYGSVHKALHKSSGRVLAIKKVAVDSELQEIIKEISIMQQCDSPFIVRYFGSYFKRSELWIVMEFCGAGSVADIMRLRQKPLEEAQIAAILKPTLLGLQYLHDNLKIHRDVKAGNILLNNEGEAKIADFGVAGSLSDTMMKRNTVIGTPFWMAPEVIQEIGYDYKADIWSLGITAIEMAEGKPPHSDIHPMRAIFMIPSHPPPTLKQPNRFSVDFNHFLSQCLKKSATDRASAADLLEHPFIKNSKPAPSVLLELIEDAAEIRERGGPDLEDEDEEEPSVFDGSEDTGTMKVASGNTAPGTMVVNSQDSSTMITKKVDDDDDDDNNTGTMVFANDVDDGSMVFHSDTSSTMKNAANVDDYKPAFLEHFDQNQVDEATTIPPTLAAVTQLKAMNINDLKARLASLDSEMEQELEELKKLYQYKRDPILKALDKKKQTSVSS